MLAARTETSGPHPETELSAFIFNVMRFATHDGPGIRTTVFFKGCPLDCWWCHNPEGRSFLPDRLYFEDRCLHCLECVAACRQHAIEAAGGFIITSAACTFCGRCTEVCAAEARQIAGKRYTLAELIAEIERDLVFFDDSGGGVTLSGGEPMAQPAFVTAFLRACRERGTQTALETCGLAQPEVLWEAARLADRVLFDLKLVDAALHSRYTGVSNELILHNLEFLAARHDAVTVRIPVIPGINDQAAEIARFADVLGRLRPRAVELLPYHRTGLAKYRRLGLDYRLADTPEPSEPDLEPFRDALRQAGLQIVVGG